ncbi:MAG: hypothetical protein Q9162_000673 [Coniocarpon cinnabarinum]
MEEPLVTYTDSPRVPQHCASAISPDGKTPGLASALSRFEYEPERKGVHDATKVLLVEWEEEHDLHVSKEQNSGEWTVEWKGPNNKREGIALKSHPLPDDSNRASSDHPSHRLYFLLQAGAPVPSHVSISFTPDNASNPTIAAAIPTLPAIFPPSLLTSGTSLGKKGVLHTLWAKSRLAALRAEIDEEEERGRFEGVGIEMARDELEWIKEHFGVVEKHYGSAASDAPASPRQQYYEIQDDSARGRPASPRDSPSQLAPPLRSPTNLSSPTSASSGSERLQQKMKGLRVGTTPSSNTQTPTPPTSASSLNGKGSQVPHMQQQVPPGVFTPPQTGSSNMASKNPLSPEVGDVAVGSRSLFAALKGPHPSESPASQTNSAAQPAASPTKPSAPAQTNRKSIAVVPPSDSKASVPQFGMASLDGVANTGFGRHHEGRDDEEPEEGLFQLPMSPRDPEAERSPFSLAGTVR